MTLMLMSAIKAKSPARFLPCYYFLTLLYPGYWINYILQKPQAASLQNVTGEKNDAILLANAEVSRIKGDILENMANIKSNLQMVKNQVNAQIAQNNYLLQGIPQKERAFLDISRQQVIKNNIYTFLLQKREETALSSASTSADLRVIESPTSYGPIRPVAKNFYLAGLVIGLLSAAFIVLLKEVFSLKVLFRSEIEDKIKVPIMGEIVQVERQRSHRDTGWKTYSNC